MKKIICISTDFSKHQNVVKSLCKENFNVSDVYLWSSVSLDDLQNFILEIANKCTDEQIGIMVDNLTACTYLNAIKLNVINENKVIGLPNINIEFYEYFNEGITSIMDESGCLGDNYLNKEQKKALNSFYAVLNNYEGNA